MQGSREDLLRYVEVEQIRSGEEAGRAMVRLQGGLRALLVGSEPHGGRLKAMAGVDIIIGRFDKAGSLRKKSNLERFVAGGDDIVIIGSLVRRRRRRRWWRR
jgi:hypothetical protein